VTIQCRNARIEALRALITVLLAMPVAACGSGAAEPEISQAEYRRALIEANHDVGSRVDDVEDFDETGSLTKAEGRLLLAALRRQTARLDEIEPPSDAEEAHESLLEGLEALLDHVDSELAALEGDNDASGDEVEDRLLRSTHANPAFNQIEKAFRQLEEAGYVPADPGG
jgi:hypothetical protein